MRKKTRNRIREAFKVVGFGFIVAAFAYGFSLTVATYGEAMYNNGVRDAFRYIEDSQREQRDPCRKTSIRDLTLEEYISNI
jgi:hypothetical protein